jgi:sugar/nucleoside kinase (ribokinase family)
VRVPLTIPAHGTRPFDIVGFGLNSIDLVAVVAEFPASNSKQRLQRFDRMPGGQTATALVTCARLGLSARYLGSFGGDDLGALARDSLVREGVDVTAARIAAGATNRFAVVVVDSRTGERTVLWDRHPGLAVAPAELERDAVISGRMLFVDDSHEIATAAQAARYARDAGIPTMVDVETVSAGISDLLQHIDVIIAAQELPAALTGYGEPGRAIEAIAREFAARLVCVTLGPEGSLTWCAGRHIHTPGFRVECVDSTGAGDAFRGAFAAACLRTPDRDLEEVLIFANAVAALNCRALGAWTGIPREDEVDRFLTTRLQM